MIMIQLLKILESVHKNGFIHLVLSPHSLAFGAENMNKNLYIIDFREALEIGEANYKEGDRIGRIDWFSSLQLHIGDIYCK